MSTGPSTATRSPEAQTFLDGVGAALADLPDEERADLLDELATHLDGLAAEGDTPLTTRLGSPQEYAAELRTAAGLPPARARGRPGARALDRGRTWLARPEVRAVRDFLWSLRSAWWVLRAWALVALLAVLSQPSWSRTLVFVPRVGTGVVGGALVVGAVVVSVQLGRGLLGRPGAVRHVSRAINVLAALVLLPILSSLSASAERFVYIDSAPNEVLPREGVYAAGQQVWNIYPYDASGRMLHDVRLYDQDGTPLDLGLALDATKQQTLDASGRKVDNAFPYRYLDPGTGEVAQPDAGPPISAPPLLGVPAVAATPTATPAPTTSA